MRRIAIGAVLAVVLAGLAVVEGQTIGSYFTRVVITSTASNALQVAGGMNSSGVINVLGANGLPATLGFTLASFGSPNIGRVFFGDGSGYTLHFSTRVSSVTTDRFSFLDSGRARAGFGSAGSPSWSFIDDTDTGIYEAGSDQLGIATGGTNRATWSSTAQTNTVPFLAPNGSVSAPSYSFTSDPDTGIYTSGSGSVVTTVNGASTFVVTPAAASLSSALLGTGVGPALEVGRNQSGDGAAGTVRFSDRIGVTSHIWVNSGLLRIGGAPNETDSTPHTGGTAVGDQSSFRASKDLLGQPTDASLLDAVLRTPIHHFRYKDGRYNGETFTGIVTDESPWFGKDQNRALNEINGLGYLVGAVRELERRLAASEARVAQLEAAR